MSNLQNSDQEIGYLKGKCEVYERIFPPMLQSVMTMVISFITKERERQPDTMASVFGGIMTDPRVQEYMKRSMDQERKGFEREAPGPI